jgi:hypothetical protein
MVIINYDKFTFYEAVDPSLIFSSFTQVATFHAKLPFVISGFYRKVDENRDV